MTNMEIIEIVNAIGNIQEDIFEIVGWDDSPSILLHTNSFVFQVLFMGILLWSSEDDERKFDESTDKYEPIEGYLRRILNEKLFKLSTVDV